MEVIASPPATPAASGSPTLSVSSCSNSDLFLPNTSASPSLDSSTSASPSFLLSAVSSSPYYSGHASLSPTLGPSFSHSLSTPDQSVSSSSPVAPTPPPTSAIMSQIMESVQHLGFKYDSLGVTPLLTDCHAEMVVTVPSNAISPSIANRKGKSWVLNYCVLSFLMNGQLFAEYQRLGNMLGLPPCSDSQWQRIVQWLGEHVTRLAQWSCEQEREQIKEHGDQEAWVASFDATT